MINCNKNITLHTKKFADIVKSNKSEVAIVNGTKVILGVISRMLENPEILNNIKEEFNS